MDSAQKRKVTVKLTQPSPLKDRAPSPTKPYVSSPSPTFRPKAKVNSSARTKPSSVVSSSAVSRAASVKSATTTPRSTSPSKSPLIRARVNARSAASSPQPPDTRHRSATTGAPQYTPHDDAALRTFSPKITAKLSKLAHPSSDQQPPSPLLSAQSHRARVASVSSSPPILNPQRAPQQQFYQSFTSTNAYVNNNSKYTPRPTAKVTSLNRVNNSVDPATVPLPPPHSPPTSSVSYSSRSSLSPSNVSFNASGVSYNTGSGVSYNAPSSSVPGSAVSSMRNGSAISLVRNGAGSASGSLNSAVDNLMGMVSTAEEDDDSDDSDDEEDDGEREGRAEDKGVTAERQVRAEAKSVRKIADLEITNRSLLTINTSLEQTKHRQAKEIRELRRKLRESRLILPPRAYRSLARDADDDADVVDLEDEDDDDDDDEEGDEDEADGKGGDGKGKGKGDETYRRVRALLDGLLDSGRRALAAGPADFPEGPKVAKVLSAYEVPDPDLSEDDAARDAPLEPAHVAVPDSDSDDDKGNDTFASEDEVERMTLPRASPSPSPPPYPPPSPRIRISEPPV